jgi:hypothetical protein
MCGSSKLSFSNLGSETRLHWSKFFYVSLHTIYLLFLLLVSGYFLALIYFSTLKRKYKFLKPSITRMYVATFQKLLSQSHVEQTFSLYSLQRKIKFMTDCLHVALTPESPNTGARRGNCSVNTFQRQQIHKQQWKNCRTRCFLSGMCCSKHSIWSERKVAD